MRYLFIIIVFPLIFGCTVSQNKTLAQTPHETVLSDNMKICAFAGDEHICIAADGVAKRNIFFGGGIYSIVLVPRSERWNGKLGLTEPSQPANIFDTENGIMRVLIAEAEIRYDSIEGALKRLPIYREDGMNVAYNDRGILVMWRKTIYPDEEALDISIFQIIINGKKPKVLPGSQNNSIVISTQCRQPDPKIQ